MTAGPSGGGEIPLTVLGGYLGAGKTTVLNRLLRDPGGRRIGVVVNDFGPLGIDAEALADAGPAGLVNLPNGCVCCTLGADLHAALSAMAERSPPPEHVVVEASGVADPAATAAWGTVPPFAPGGVVVLAAADSVMVRADDRLVGAEVRRQLAGADVVVVSRSDLVDGSQRDRAVAWCEVASGGAPVVIATNGRLPTEVVLGVRPDRPPVGELGAGHDVSYVTWSWERRRPIGPAALDDFLAGLPAAVLRLKGWVHLDGGTTVGVDVVGRSRTQRRLARAPRGSRLVAIAVGDRLDLVPPAE